jgi:uncharacterized protein (DUF362 family)
MIRIMKRILREAFAPRILRRKTVSRSMPGPRMSRLPPEPGKAKVFSINTGSGLPSANKTLAGALGELLPDILGSRILVKININTADPYPASTSPEFLAVLVKMLEESGASEIIVGDCSSIRCLPTRRVFAATTLANSLNGKARFIPFDEGPWVNVPVQGLFFKDITVPEIVFDVDLVLFLANIKSQAEADFSFGLKLAIGLMHPIDRRLLHKDHLAQRIAEANIAVEPDLTIIDGRRAMITGGPDQGETYAYQKIILGRNRLAIDLEAYRCLFQMRAQRGINGLIEEDPFIHPQIRHAMRIGLGGSPFPGYEVIVL